MVEYGYVDAPELRIKFPESQPFSRTRKGQKKAAREPRQAASVYGSKSVESVESTTYMKSGSESFKAVEKTRFSKPVDPIICYTEAACTVDRGHPRVDHCCYGVDHRAGVRQGARDN